jgi:hypothetical protein
LTSLIYQMALELSSPPDSLDGYSNEHTKDKEAAWYNLPSDSDDSDNNSAVPTLLFASLTAFVLTTLRPKEYSTGTRIKAIYMLEDKKSLR